MVLFTLHTYIRICVSSLPCLRSGSVKLCSSEILLWMCSLPQFYAICAKVPDLLLSWSFFAAHPASYSSSNSSTASALSCARPSFCPTFLCTLFQSILEYTLSRPAHMCYFLPQLFIMKKSKYSETVSIKSSLCGYIIVFRKRRSSYPSSSFFPLYTLSPSLITASVSRSYVNSYKWANLNFYQMPKIVSIK